MNSTLENLCRELNKQNKHLENKLIAQQELISKYEAMIQQMKQSHDSSFDDIQDLKTKFQTYLTEFESKEKQFLETLKSKDLEIQLAHAKSQQQDLVFQQEIQKLGVELVHSKTAEIETRKELTETLQNVTLMKKSFTESNHFFEEFKTKLDVFSKRIVKLEKEKKELESRLSLAHVKLIDDVNYNFEFE